MTRSHSTPGQPASTNKKQQRQDAAVKRQQMRPLQNKIQKLEKQMETYNKEKQTLHEQLADSELYDEENKDKLKAILEKQTKVEQVLQEVEEEWLLANEEMEGLG